jgi:acetyl esterase/lipase
VVSVDYRLGPENPYPAAVVDAELALKWLYQQGSEDLGVDLTRLAVGGSSRFVSLLYTLNGDSNPTSGGNLAAIVTHQAAMMTPPIPIMFQLLIVPVTDNTAQLSGHPHASWLENQHAASLTPAKMMWFRNNYLPNSADWSKWDASPLLVPEEWFKRVPKAWIAVCELDVLRDEGLAYANSLRKAGVEVEVKNYQRAPHPIMAMDGRFHI